MNVSKECGVRVVKVEGEETKDNIMWLKEVLCTSYGPWGHYVLLRPSTASVITLTRNSHKIMQLLQSNDPLIKNIVSHLQGHASCYKDSTLYGGLLACK